MHIPDPRAHAIAARNIHAVITDVDGCLTDGTIGFTAAGDSFRLFHTHDGLGAQRLRDAGIAVGWLSAGNRPESIYARAETIGIEHVDVAPGEKGARFNDLCTRMGVTPDRTIYMGDDLKDLPAMENAAMSACPADAVPPVRERADLVTRLPGGRGAFRELAELLLAAQTLDKPERP